MRSFSDTPLSEIILRRYESPVGLSMRNTLKKICLSIGLLQIGDSRDVIVDILYVVDEAKKKKIELTSIEIKQEVLRIRKEFGLSDNGCADSNIRRQLKRLRDIFLVEKIKNKYRTYEFLSLSEIFESKIKKIIVDTIIERNIDYFKYYERFESEEKSN